MSRSILITFLIVFLAMANVDQTQGLASLAGIVNRVRNNSIWGSKRRTTTNNSRQQNSLLPVQGTMSKQVMSAAEESTSSLPNLITAPAVTFDVDSYRQEMTDLVYQRNMQRMFND